MTDSDSAGGQFSQILDSQRAGLQSDLMTLAVLDEDIAGATPELFGTVVSEVLTNTLGENDADAVRFYIGEANLQDPERVFAGLASLLGDGSPFVRDAIWQEFQTRIRLLNEQLMLSILVGELAVVTSLGSEPQAITPFVRG